MKVWKYNNLYLDESDSFIYEVDIYSIQPNQVQLENTRLYSCDSFIDNLIDFSKEFCSNGFIFKYTTLIKAPLKWLESNAELVNIETKKEKLKQKKDNKNGK